MAKDSLDGELLAVLDFIDGEVLVILNSVAKVLAVQDFLDGEVPTLYDSNERRVANPADGEVHVI